MNRSWCSGATRRREAVEGHLRWGLIPHFCETRPDFQPIHARAETISDNELFKDAYRKRRCIVPMDSFFQKDDGGRRYAISRRDGEPFGVAGIWENWNDPASRQWIRTFAIITVPANDIVATIHDRMPALAGGRDRPLFQQPVKASDAAESKSS